MPYVIGIFVLILLYNGWMMFIMRRRMNKTGQPVRHRKRPKRHSSRRIRTWEDN